MKNMIDVLQHKNLHICVTLTPEEYKKVTEYAEREGMMRGQLLKIAVFDYINRNRRS